jgi:circadian clock protein KaiC
LNAERTLERSFNKSMTNVLTADQRIKTGIPGLDPLIQGGLHIGDVVLLVGGIGSGKTTFSAQFVYNSALSNDEPAVFATFEEDADSLRKNMLRYGMDFKKLEQQGKLKLIDLQVLEGSGLGANIESVIAALDEVKSKRLVIDSLTAFLSGATEKFDYTFLMHLIYKTLKRENITTMMTVSKFNDTSLGIEEFIADGIFQMDNYISNQMEMRTRFMIKKLRGTEHSRSYHTVAFTDKGLQILPWNA